MSKSLPPDQSKSALAVIIGAMAWTMATTDVVQLGASRCEKMPNLTERNGKHARHVGASCHFFPGPVVLRCSVWIDNHAGCGTDWRGR